MTDKAPQKYRALSREELNELAGEELSERAAMSLINANVAAPINAAAAAYILTEDSVAPTMTEEKVDTPESAS